jgi:NAD(P)-dependent dehydrogenase (short-subunit alcohol dehydrogenase family)
MSAVSRVLYPDAHHDASRRRLLVQGGVVSGLALASIQNVQAEKRLSEAMAETGIDPGPNPTPQQAWDTRAPTVPLKVGWLQPDDISPAAVFLAADAAAMVTGAEFEVTGGDSAKDI